MTCPQDSTSRYASGRDTEDIELKVINTETPLPQPDSRQDITNTATETTPFIPSHHQSSAPGGEHSQSGAVIIRVDPFTLLQSLLNDSTTEIERPARLPLTRTGTEAATGGSPSNSFSAISPLSMNSSEAPHRDRGDTEDPPHHVRGDNEEHPPHHDRGDNEDYQAHHDLEDNEDYQAQNAADHNNLSEPEYLSNMCHSPTVLIPFSFGMTMEEFNSILRETDNTERRNLLVEVGKAFTTRLNTFCTMSLGIVGFGFIFAITSFITGINIQNRAAAHDLFICTIFAAFSTLVFVWLRWTERSLFVPNDVPLMQIAGYLVAMIVGVLFMIIAMALLLTALLDSFWMGDDDAGFRLGVTVMIIVLSLIVAILFFWILYGYTLSNAGRQRH